LPQLSYSALLASLPKLGGGVFYLSGDEEYLKDEAARRIVDHFLDPATRDFNLDQLRGADVTPESLGSVIATPPMMAEHRVVLVRDGQTLSPKAREVVEAVAAEPPAGLALVIVATQPASSKAKFYTNLKKLARAVEFGSVDPVDLPGWVAERAREAHGLGIEPEAARALAAASAGQLGVLASEIQKLAAFVGDRQEITIADVRAVGGYIPRVDRWEWFDLVGERRIPEALSKLPALLESGESGVGLVIGIASQMLRIALVVAGGKEALEKELKPYQRWLAGRVVPQARRWAQREVDLAISELLRTDRLLKTASLTDRQAIEELLLRLAELGAPRGAPGSVAEIGGSPYLPAV
jgi:DNA polymerase-3 subunit delta